MLTRCFGYSPVLTLCLLDSGYVVLSESIRHSLYRESRCVVCHVTSRGVLERGVMERGVLERGVMGVAPSAV